MKNLERFYYHSEHTRCFTYFRIDGNFDPDIISETLALKPEKSWKIGDKRKNGTSYDFACWKFGTCAEYDVEVSNQMLKTITPLLPKISILKELKKKYDINYTLEVVPTVRFDESTPCLAPSKEIIRFCYETDTDIDIDLYVSCPDDFEDGEVWELD